MARWHDETWLDSNDFIWDLSYLSVDLSMSSLTWLTSSDRLKTWLELFSNAVIPLGLVSKNWRLDYNWSPIPWDLTVDILYLKWYETWVGLAQMTQDWTWDLSWMTWLKLLLYYFRLFSNDLRSESNLSLITWDWTWDLSWMFCDLRAEFETCL